MDYNKTINLPKTDFPMRAGLPKREPEMLKRWEDMDLYNELLKKNAETLKMGTIETAKEAVRQYQNFEEICVTRAGCTVSSHCGPGTIGVLFLHEG